MTITFRLTDLRRAALPLGVPFGHSPYGTSSRGRPGLDFFDLIFFISHVSQCRRHPALTRRPVSIVGICVSRAYGYRAFGCIGLDFVTYPIMGGTSANAGGTIARHSPAGVETAQQFSRPTGS